MPLHAGKEGKGDDYMNSGEKNFSQKKYSNALSDFNNAYDKYRADNDQLKGKKAQAKKRAGDTCVQLNKLNDAVAYYHDASNEHSDAHNWKDAGSMMQQAGDVYVMKMKVAMQSGNMADAKQNGLSARDDYHKAAQKYGKSNHGMSGAGESLIKAGHAMTAVQVYAKASYDYRNAGEQYAENDEKATAAGLAKLAGDSIIKAGANIDNYADAENHYARAGHWFGQLNDAANQSYSQGCYLLAAQAAMEAGKAAQVAKDYDKARKNYEIAGVNFYEGKNITYVVVANNAVAAMCALLHKNSAAGEYYGFNGLIYSKAYEKEQDNNYLRYAITMYQKAGAYAAVDGSYKKSAEYYTAVGDLYALLFNDNCLAFYNLAKQQYKKADKSVPDKLKEKIIAVS